MPWGRSPSLYQGWEKEQSEWSVTKAQLLLLAAGLPAPRTVCGSWESPEVLLVDVGVKPPSLREVEWFAQGRPASIAGGRQSRRQATNPEPFCGPPLLGGTREQDNVSGPSSASSPLSQATATACSSRREPSFAQASRGHSSRSVFKAGLSWMCVEGNTSLARWAGLHPRHLLTSLLNPRLKHNCKVYF